MKKLLLLSSCLLIIPFIYFVWYYAVPAPVVKKASSYQPFLVLPDQEVLIPGDTFIVERVRYHDTAIDDNTFFDEDTVYLKHK